MDFNLTHPSIVQLYISAIELYILQEKLETSKTKKLNKELQKQIDLVASKYIISVKDAEELFGSPDIVQKQLNIFSIKKLGQS
ncbi:MAG: hypothetical protein WC942_01140 [Clostridia bacterium]|jgi:hypothetical protein